MNYRWIKFQGKPMILAHVTMDQVWGWSNGSMKKYPIESFTTDAYIYSTHRDVEQEEACADYLRRVSVSWFVPHRYKNDNGHILYGIRTEGTSVIAWNVTESRILTLDRYSSTLIVQGGCCDPGELLKAKTAAAEEDSLMRLASLREKYSAAKAHILEVQGAVESLVGKEVAEEDIPATLDGLVNEATRAHGLEIKAMSVEHKDARESLLALIKAKQYDAVENILKAFGEV